MLIAPLFEGPLDVIGDEHGEIRPLRRLLKLLGYNDRGEHPEGRRLVFVGDLTDRGEDSPAVLELVRAWVARGQAQCLLGNHELNLLRQELKDGNAWFMDPTHPEQQHGGEFAHSKAAPEHLKDKWLEFLATLPLALERPDLRVVHAAWVAGAVEALRHSTGSILDVYRAYERQTHAQLALEGITGRAKRERDEWKGALRKRDDTVPLLRAVGECDERQQMANPVRVVTSGVERLASTPFWSSGQWRMCVRVRWWDEYDEAVPVIVGHYWRRFRPITASDHASKKPEMFDGVEPTVWVGKRQNVFCTDFSVGARYQERMAGMKVFASHLGAMRWPERELWFDTGQVLKTT